MPDDIKRVLTIAGSDSGGGAGIQADLKTIAALGCYGASVITAVTAQNTCEVRSIHTLPPEEVRQQLEAVLDDISIDAVKTGMLANAAIIETVAAVLKQRNVKNIVVDPVMISKGGAHLLREDAVAALIQHLIPLATVLTPNVPEAAALTGTAVDEYTNLQEVLVVLHQLGPLFVLLKGGHFGGPEAIDYLYDGNIRHLYKTPRVPTLNTHGTGCTYSAAIAAYLAAGLAPPEAVRCAKAYLTGAIKASDSLHVGKGIGPLHHGWNLHITADWQ